MTFTLMLTANIVLDVALVLGLAFMMTRPTKLTPPRPRPVCQGARAQTRAAPAASRKPACIPAEPPQRTHRTSAELLGLAAPARCALDVPDRRLRRHALIPCHGCSRRL